MQTSVTFKNLDSSDTLKAYVQDKLNRFDRLLDNPAEANVVLSVEKFRHMAEINIVGDRLSINGKEETVDMYSAIDMVLDKMEKQIKKSKEKIRERRSNARPLNQSMLEEDIRGTDDESSNINPWMSKKLPCSLTCSMIIFWFLPMRIQIRSMFCTGAKTAITG